MDESKDRLLLVDDNMTNLQVLFQALEAEGYELLVAQSGEEALEIAREALPQLVLLDINMPGIDGFETCRRLKQGEARDASVIYLSARGDVEDKLEGFGTGAVDYISKPFQFEEVLARVRAHLEAWHERNDLARRNAELAERATGGFVELDEDSLRERIARGEDERAEFKSTLRTNLHTGKKDKRMENACLKSIAGFLNSAGGILLVGVADDGEPLGLDADGFPNEDKLLLYLNALVRNHLGANLAPLLQSRVHDYQGRRILSVQCLPSDEPVFFRHRLQ